MARHASGFTLIELVVTIAIVGVLASGVLPMIEVTVQRNKEQELRAALMQIRSAIDAYRKASLEGRIIMVTSGEVVGMFTIKELHPQPQYWVRPEGSRVFVVNMTEADVEIMKTAITKKLVDLLKGLDVQPSRVALAGFKTADTGW